MSSEPGPGGLGISLVTDLTTYVTGTRQLTMVGADVTSDGAGTGGVTITIGGSKGITAHFFNATTAPGYEQNGTTILTTVQGTGVGNVLVGGGGGSLTTSHDNILIGNGAGFGLSTASGGAGTGYQTAIGTNALHLNNGGENIAIGSNTLPISVSDIFNIALGNDALVALNGGNDNVAIGHAAAGGVAPWSGANNVAIGDSVFSNASGSASSNVYIGQSAGRGTVSNLNTASDNVGVGWSALLNVTTGSPNCAVGFTAMEGTSAAPLTGANNSAFGTGALATIQGGAAFNTAIGHHALVLSTTASNNTALGYLAGSIISTGAANLILGSQVASTTLQTGSGNILIGVTSACDTAAAGTSNTFLLQGNGATAVMTASALNTTPIVTFPGALITIGASGLPIITSGSGAPSATQPNGSLYLRTDGGANTRLYVSEGGGTWAAISSS